jgi:phosphatidylglycerophosphatase A
MAMLVGWEIVLILAMVLMLFLFGAGRPSSDKASFDPATHPGGERLTSNGTWDGLVLWLAQGFGSGRIPWAPGTFGSVLGVLWFAILLSFQSVWGFAAGLVSAVLASIWICGKGERILNERDPGSIVLDEICAVPICFTPWVVSEWLRKETWPPIETFFGPSTWYLTVIIFVLFRIFDIVKPPPVRQSQRLPGGLGVVADDVLAALYVCALSLIVFH